MVNISIMDVLGRVVRKVSTEVKAGLSKYNMDVSDLSAGTYILHVKTEDGRYFTTKNFMID